MKTEKPKVKKEPLVKKDRPFFKYEPVLNILKNKNLYRTALLYLGTQLTTIILFLSVQMENAKGMARFGAIAVNILLIVSAVKIILDEHKKETPANKPDLKLIIISFILLLASIHIMAFLIAKFNLPTTAQPNQETLNMMLSYFPILLIFGAVVVAPLIEEVVFRELLPKIFGGSTLSFILCTVLFIAVHSPSGMLGWVNYGVIAFGFLYVRLKSDNVWAAVAVHILWNAAAMIL